MAKPGDTIVVDGTEFIAGEDGQWRPNTSVAGQMAQAVTIDAPVGLIGLAEKASNIAGAIFQPGAPSTNITPRLQQGYEGLTRSLGVNVAPPQTRGQRFARAMTGGLESAPMAMASGGVSIPGAVAGSVGGSVAAQGIAETGLGPVPQFAGGLAADFLLSRSPKKTSEMLSGAASHIANMRKINAWKLVKPLDLADEGSASLMKQVDEAHKTALGTMESAYKKVGKAQFPVSGRRLAEARDAILEEAGSINSPRAPGSIIALVEEKIRRGNGTITLPELRTLQKDVNAFLDTADPTRTGLAQAQGMIRGKLVPAIQQTLDDMVAAGEAASKSGPAFGPKDMPGARSAAFSQKQSVEALREANKQASKYYDLFDKRSALTKELVDGIAGGQRLDATAAFQKIFSDPKQSVNYARAIMEIVGDNPKNAAIMRRTLVEAVVGTDPTKFSAKTAHTNFNKMRFVADEVLGKQGSEHFKKLLLSMEKNQEKVVNTTRAMTMARGAGALVGYASGGASPWIGGLLGAGIGDASIRTYQYMASHFGEAAAEQLAKEAFFDPSVYNLLRTNISKFSTAQLDQLTSAARRSLVRSGFRFTVTGNRPPMLPSEQNTPAPTAEELNRFRRKQ